MSGTRLEVHVHLITASQQEHNVILNSLHDAHLAMDESIFEPVAAAYCATSETEREHGVAVIDIGAHTTDVAVYNAEALVGSFSVRIGGDNFTKDLAHFLTSSRE